MNKRGKYLLAKELKEKGYPFKRIIEMLEIKKNTYYYHFKEKRQKEKRICEYNEWEDKE